jgi:hypothetical protein
VESSGLNVARDYCVTDVWAVLPDRIVERATVVVEDGLIVSVVENGAAHIKGEAVAGAILLGATPDVGIDEDLDSSCDLLAGGRFRKIDVVRVNEDEYMVISSRGLTKYTGD